MEGEGMEVTMSNLQFDTLSSEGFTDISMDIL